MFSALRLTIQDHVTFKTIVEEKP